MIAVGDGRERFGSAFFVDGGSSCGEIQGSSKVINAVSIRHQRPFRAATASDDASIVFFTGVPYKNDKVIRTHTRFVQDVRYSPSGDHFVSVGSDGKMFLYDGKDGSTAAEIVASQGSVLAVSWSGDSKRLSTSSADGTVKIWDAETRQAVQTYTIGTDVASQQNGNVWANENSIVSLGLDGTLNVIDPRVDGKWNRIHGAPKAISSSVLANKPEPTFYTGSFDGSVRAFELPTGKCSAVEGSKGEGQVTGFAYDESVEDGKVWTTGWGAAGGLQAIKAGTYDASIASDSEIDGSKAIAASAGRVAVADVSGVTMFENGKKIHTISVKEGCSAVALNGSHLAYGGNDKKIHLASADGGSETIFDDSRGEIICLAFSQDAKYLAGGDSSGRIVLIDVAAKKTIVSSKWTAHTSRVNSLTFSPDGLRIVSGGLDESIYIWSVEKTLRNVPIKNAHAGGVNGVSWLDAATIISAGADACVRTWTVSGP
ncbi:hypothetical protein FFLO_06688 [Filobasidium floriforme]|uniref:Uncharacterized protein n=1 Tax=Filobasidium floriforme TaxID=5210 RepID=A0A8K0JK16_9TREE|nr:hypothetical protein FFLO_06688 [Filobasidium floriforme]